jgi:hypothetical protein
MDANLFKEYSFEEFVDGKPNTKPKEPSFVFEQPKFKDKKERLLDKLLDTVDKLPDNHEAVQFCLSRAIPKDKFNKIYFIENIKNIVQLNDKYKESIRGEEPRLVFPFYDEYDNLSAVTCRAIRGEALRYITVKIKENTSLIYGLDRCDKTQDIFVLEGPIDSLFLDNSIAMSGTSVGKLSSSTLPKDKLVVIFDNQPRNKEVCGIINKTIDQGYRVVIWPQTILEKDVNEMVLAGKNVRKIIKDNIFSNLEAKAKFISWTRI